MHNCDRCGDLSNQLIDGLCKTCRAALIGQR
jgi:NMD protein affecting ribosome stability and mRNA decay